MSNSKQQSLVVVKSNEIINASFRLSILEQRLILACIAKMDSQSEVLENDSFTVSASEMLEIQGSSESEMNAYKDLKIAVSNLYDRSITFSESSNHVGTVRWVSRVDYYQGEGRVSLRFTKEVLRYLGQLRESFTKYKLVSVSQFRSSYSFRIYEMLAQYLKIGKREITIDEIRLALCLEDRYEKVAELKRNVIDVAIRDINDFSDLFVSYVQKKKGRIIHSFVFSFSEKEEKQQNQRQHQQLPQRQHQQGSSLYGIPKDVIERERAENESYEDAAVRLLQQSSSSFEK